MGPVFDRGPRVSVIRLPEATTKGRRSRAAPVGWVLLFSCGGVARRDGRGHARRRPARRRVAVRGSSTQAEALHDGAVTLDVGLLEIVQEPPALADEQQQATTAVVVVLVLLEVLGQVGDAVREQRDLHLRGAGVALGGGVLGDDLLLGLRVGTDGHVDSLHGRCAARRGTSTRALLIRGRQTATPKAISGASRPEI